MSYGRQGDNAIRGLGLNTKYGKKPGAKGARVRAFEQGAASALEAFELDMKRKATHAERSQILHDLAIEERRSTWGGLSSELLGVDDIPAEHMNEVPLIIDSLRRKGLTVTGANIYDMYRRNFAK